MRIGGLLKQSLTDYPGFIAAMIFTRGCNLRCWYCHNPQLVLDHESNEISEESVLEFLTARVGWLEGVVISGGEPTLHPDLPRLIGQIKRLGYRVKLDTNGTNPDMVDRLLAGSLIDYVAMDIKTILVDEELSRLCGVHASGMADLMRKTISVILSSGVDRQFRTTWIDGYHGQEFTDAIASIIGKDEPLIINRLNCSNPILRDFINQLEK